MLHVIGHSGDKAGERRCRGSQGDQVPHHPFRFKQIYPLCLNHTRATHTHTHTHTPAPPHTRSPSNSPVPTCQEKRRPFWPFPALRSPCVSLTAGLLHIYTGKHGLVCPQTPRPGLPLPALWSWTRHLPPLKPFPQRGNNIPPNLPRQAVLKHVTKPRGLSVLQTCQDHAHFYIRALHLLLPVPGKLSPILRTCSFSSSGSQFRHLLHRGRLAARPS